MKTYKKQNQEIVQAHGEVGRPQYKVRAGKLRIHRSFNPGTFVDREHPCDGVLASGCVIPADL